MRKTLFLLGLGFLTTLVASSHPSPEEIIRKFAEKETEFRDVWRNYTYTQEILFQVLDDFGQVREQQQMTIEVYFTTDGKRQTRKTKERGSLRSVRVSKEDVQDAVALQPFVLTTEELPDYEIEYHGRERVDELDTFVFNVKPGRVKKGKRYFKGRIWVDTEDYQIVKTRGKAIPDYSNNKFPQFETIRQQVDGKYWFPVWTEADDVLRFGGGFRSRDVHVRELITYRDFKKFEVDTSITYKPLEKP